MDMAGTDWVALGGIAQLAAAFGTLTLAVVTGRMVKRTHELGQKADRQIEAAQREAEATERLAIEEPRTDRQLLWRPQLDLAAYHHEDNADTFSFTVGNSGAGPALQVVCLAREMGNVGRWCIIRMGDLRPGVVRSGSGLLWAAGGDLRSPYDQIPGASDFVTVVLVCSDVLGRRFRFGYTKPLHERPEQMHEMPRPLPAEVSSVTQAHPVHAEWAREPMIWGGYSPTAADG